MTGPILYPAIDLKQGACVRLRKGDMDQATLYNSDPAAQAAEFVADGFSWLHVVDLDGAFAGESRNGAAIGAILEAVAGAMSIQLGGGIRNRAQIEAWLERGIQRVILGTVAVKDPELVLQAAAAFPGQIAVGIDARGGRVAVEGWASEAAMDAIDLARRFQDAGVAAIIYTDIDRDGVLTGINWDSTIQLAETVDLPVIASGGLAGMEDVRRLARQGAGKLNGAITGRALYDGRIDPKAALALLQCPPPADDR